LLLNLDEYDLSQVEARGLVGHFIQTYLASAFQPIVNASGDVLGREALLRASLLAHGEVSPQAAFDDAAQADRLVQFDRLVRTIHLLNHSRSFSEDELLFLNVDPRLLSRVNDHGQTFEQILHYYSVPTSRVVIEIKEAAVADQVVLAQAIQNYRNLGYQIAVDDFGASNSGINRILNRQRSYSNLVSNQGYGELDRVLALRPNMVKLDPAIIRAAEQNSSVATVLIGLVNIFHHADIRVVIEGIETAKQLAIAQQTGADLFQGYFLGQPEFAPAPREELCSNDRLAA
jgi:EAL domain-containing protein (putative c-di-GMP-specific phosphodiesterase class I)